MGHWKGDPGPPKKEGWGAKVIDRLSHDLKSAFPDMNGLSPRNLKYMRTFSGSWPDRELVQRTVALIPWRSNIAHPDRNTILSDICELLRIRHTHNLPVMDKNVIKTGRSAEF